MTNLKEVKVWNRTVAEQEGNLFIPNQAWDNSLRYDSSHKTFHASPVDPNLDKPYIFENTHIGNLGFCHRSSSPCYENKFQP